MTETQDARRKILDFIESTNKKSSDLAVMFNVSKAYMSEVLNGKKTGPAANELILSIISAFKIR